MRKRNHVFRTTIVILLLGLLFAAGGKGILLWVENSSFQDYVSEASEAVKEKNFFIGQQDLPEKQKIKSISTGNYAYECLNQEEKTVYDQILAAILEHKEKVVLDTTSVDTMKKSYLAINSDYGGLFWVEGYVFTRYTKGEELVSLEFAPTYIMSEEEQKDTQQQIDAAVEQWLSGVSITDSDYDKAKYVFETLIQNVDYVEGAANNQNIVSVFLNRETVCQGYSCATQYLLNQLGIPSTVIAGKANGQSHAWNLVRLDGDYYYMDTTWGNSTYLDSQSIEEKYVNYNYFLMTEAELRLTHEPDMQLPLPECNAIKDTYYVQEQRYFDVFDADTIGAIFSAAWNNGESSISLKFSGTEVYDQVKEYFIVQQKIAGYCSGLEYVYYLEDKDLHVLTVNFN